MILLCGKGNAFHENLSPSGKLVCGSAGIVLLLATLYPLVFESWGSQRLILNSLFIVCLCEACIKYQPCARTDSQWGWEPVLAFEGLGLVLGWLQLSRAEWNWNWVIIPKENTYSPLFKSCLIVRIETFGGDEETSWEEVKCTQWGNIFSLISTKDPWIQ